MADRDSRLRGARVVQLNGSASLTGRLPRNDFEDLVRFNLGSSSNVNIDVTNIARRNNVDVELYRLRTPLAQISRRISNTEFRRLRPSDRNATFDLVASSRNRNNSNESLAATTEGELVLRFVKRSGNGSGYRATITATPAAPTPGPSPNPLPGPSPNPSPNPSPSPSPDPSGSVPITPLPSSNSIGSNLSATAPLRRYSVDLTAAGDYQFNLTGLSADANLQVFAADGTTSIKASANLGTAPERVILPLDAGRYIIDVAAAPGTTTTNFGLNLQKLTDNVSNDADAPTNLGTLSQTTPVNRVNYVVSGGKDSPVDYYEFQVPTRGYAQFNLTGRPGENSILFGDLDIDLYEVNQPIGDGASADSAGTGAEVLGGTVKPGRTYRIRVQPKNLSTDPFNGSGYNLRISFGPRNSNPSIVRDIIPGTGSSSANNFVSVNGVAYFTADSIDAQGVPRTSLWQSDGSLNRTTRLFDFNRGANLTEFTDVGGKLYFVANAGSGNELWTSDGTAAGTRQVADLAPGAASSNPTDLTALGNNLFFYANIPPAQGTGASIQRLYRLNTANSTAQPELLASSDFTESNTSIAFDAPPDFTVVGNDLYFSGTDENGGTELWQASINGAGNVTLNTMILRNGAINGSLPSNLTNVNGTLFLIADVAQGTQEVVRIDQFASGGNPGSFTVFNINGSGNAEADKLTYVSETNRLYFTARDASVGNELFNIDLNSSTPTPTLVQDISQGQPNGNSNPTNLVNVGGKLIFSAADDSTSSPTVDGNTLWITDGVTTRKLSTLSNGVGETDFGGRLNTLTDLREFTVIGDNLFFVATNSTIGRELRQISLSGSSVTTVTGVLEGFDLFGGNTTDPITGTTPNSSNPTGLAVVGSFIFFRANTGAANGVEPFSVLP